MMPVASAAFAGHPWSSVPPTSWPHPKVPLFTLARQSTKFVLVEFPATAVEFVPATVEFIPETGVHFVVATVAIGQARAMPVTNPTNL